MSRRWGCPLVILLGLPHSRSMMAGMQRRITDPYEVLGLEHGATTTEIRAAYLRLAKKHHPDKNSGDRASEWIFKEVQRAYETLRDAEANRTVDEERPPRTQENQSRTRNSRSRPRAERESHRRERAERSRQQQRSSGPDARERSQRAQRRRQEDSGTEHTCACGSTARWSTKLPLKFRLTAAWIKWVVGVGIGGVLFCVPAYFAVFLVGFLPALLLDFLGVAADSEVVEGVVAVATFGVAYGCAIWVTQKPKMCRQCGCVSARLWE